MDPCWTLLSSEERPEFCARTRVGETVILSGVGEKKLLLAHELQTTRTQQEAQLEGFRTTLRQYSANQFDVYRQLWESLCDLKVAADELWHSPTEEKVNAFSNDLTSAKRWLEKSSLLVEEEHYHRLNGILEEFTQFWYGKDLLVRLRHDDSLSGPERMEERRRIVSGNAHARESFGNALKELREYFQRHMRGE